MGWIQEMQSHCVAFQASSLRFGMRRRWLNAGGLIACCSCGLPSSSTCPRRHFSFRLGSRVVCFSLFDLCLHPAASCQLVYKCPEEVRIWRGGKKNPPFFTIKATYKATICELRLRKGQPRQLFH